MISFFPSREVFVELLGFSVHWYGIMYLLAFIIAYKLTYKLQAYRTLGISREDISTIVSYTILGVILGGRLGYVFLYNPSYYLAHPIEILYVWHGGMSSHGGFVGVFIALIFVLRKKNISLLAFLDVITVPVAIGLALGRFGNFINLELYGTQTDIAWAMEIPGVEGLRHPTFFYALAKDLFIAIVCYLHLRTKRPVAGSTIALFLMLYSILRFIIEYYREQPHALFELGSISLTRGQLYSIPLLLLGLTLFVLSHKRQSS